MFVLLMVAQLSTIGHASAYGAGQHEHEGVLCVYGVITDDDPDEATSSSITVTSNAEKALCSSVVFDRIYPRSHFVVPPATGPPLHS